jgi:plastocyanin
MTDTTTEEAEDSTDVEAAPTTDVETPPASPLAVPFWNRPYVERYLVPLVLPAAVIVGVVMYVLNVSRLFLSAHGHTPIIIGTVITLVILVGASVLAGSRLRPSSTLMVTAGFLIALTFAGWISLGHSQDKEGNTGPLAETVLAKQTLKVTAAPGGAFAFAPNQLTAKTGLVKITVNFASAGHSFAFHEGDTRFAELKPPGAGPVTGVGFFPAPGQYHFYCTYAGHEAAGMHGIITVTGPAMTIDEAATQAGNAPGSVK